jgi:hypothetical protein
MKSYDGTCGRRWRRGEPLYAKGMVASEVRPDGGTHFLASH